MKISAEKTYKVKKYFYSENRPDMDYGNIPGKDLQAMLKGYQYDNDFEMFFSEKATMAFDVREAD